MKKYFFVIMFFVFQNLQAQQILVQEPIELPVGEYYYLGEFNINYIRDAITVNLNSDAGQKRLKQLRADGFSCQRKTPETRLCQKTYKSQTKPENLKKSVENFLYDVRFNFFQNQNPLVPGLDTATEISWMVQSQSLINKTMIQQMKLTHFYETNEDILSFPVSQEQPISYVKLLQKDLYLPLVVQQSVQDIKRGYFIEAKFSHFY